ncbi:Metallo-hydrolase/oxidoreductase [Trichocladium antarcticum]|uniref:Metallo-hydrolase/oxidoreductase n=1 Tax=Trichocladium antarcticum TaxID=1450529 RepID=A0AAN6ULD0_9PEZI|nr:Metallo-hydrolase/oxidoreductase [Trichocladium antarcticum]
MLAIGAITKSKTTAHPPEHHVVPTNRSNPSQAGAVWTSYLPAWAPSPKKPRTHRSLRHDKPTGFRNPWPSWHKPTAAEIWKSLQWGADDSVSIDLATSHLPDFPAPRKPDGGIRPRFSDTTGTTTGTTTTRNAPAAQASQLLRIQPPDFAFPPPTNPDAKAKVTWLGHATLLLQLALDTVVGPLRAYPAPCTAQDLPVVDAVFVSHNHYDHMDCASLRAVWQHSRERVRFFVPVGNGRLLVEMGIDEGRVVEMDWWDQVDLGREGGRDGDGEGVRVRVRVWCTPSQHGSARVGAVADEALWAGWVVEGLAAGGEVGCRVFFAGDTGYQFHGAPGWPFDLATAEKRGAEEEKFPACPAFAEIRERIGPPDLLLLPVSVGATFSYLRSFAPLPDSINPVPRHSGGVAGANHMPPWDAVRVFNVMSEGWSAKKGADGEAPAPPVAVAMHWGTFVTDPTEVLRTLGDLEWACQQQGVRFARALPELLADGDISEEGTWKGVTEPLLFVALNHGQSICI